MTLAELYQGLKELGYPVAYRSFAKGKVPMPPYIVYESQGTEPFAADGEVYCEREDINIELYTAKKDVKTEEKIRSFLKEKGIIYNVDEAYIESENLIQIIFSINL